MPAHRRARGPDAAQAAAINVFNPDQSWDKADMTP
jgi:hypothetical protein